MTRDGRFVKKFFHWKEEVACLTSLHKVLKHEYENPSQDSSEGDFHKRHKNCGKRLSLCEKRLAKATKLMSYYYGKLSSSAKAMLRQEGLALD